MPAPAKPSLKPGRVYRTEDLGRWGANPSRLAKRLVRTGELVELRHGLFYRPERSRFGPVPAADRELMRAFLRGGRFVFTGPTQWNALRLGSTAMFAEQLVYNTKRSGTFQFGNRRFVLVRRGSLPRAPDLEWFAVDLLENHRMAGVGFDEVCAQLSRAVAAGRLHAARLRRAADRYGSRKTRAAVYALAS